MSPDWVCLGWGTKSGCDGWVCVNCVADVGVEKKKFMVLMCRGRDSSLFMEGLEVLWK